MEGVGPSAVNPKNALEHLIDALNHYAGALERSARFTTVRLSACPTRFFIFFQNFTRSDFRSCLYTVCKGVIA